MLGCESRTVSEPAAYSELRVLRRRSGSTASSGSVRNVRANEGAAVPESYK